MIPFGALDPEFAKSQLLLLLSDRYMHPSGQVWKLRLLHVFRTYNFGLNLGLLSWLVQYVTKTTESPCMTVTMYYISVNRLFWNPTDYIRQ